MCSSYQLFVLVLLSPLFRPSVGATISSKPNDVIGDIRQLLIREADTLTNGTLTKGIANRTNTPLIPDDDIIGQIINLLHCGPFPISPNSHLQYSLDYATKNLRLLQACNRYFRMTKKPGSLQVQCKYSKWIFNEIGCEKITCPRLTAPPGGHISTNDNTYETTVYFWCSRGFNINGTEKLFCEDSGLWNLPPPTCHVSYCRPLLSPRHGFVSSQEGTATDQTVEFRCESGYTLIGDAVLRCQDDNRWNNTAPVCKKMCTVPNISQSEGVRLVPELSELSIGSLIQRGQRVIFSCKPGYTASVSGTSICIGGTWRPPIRCRKACVAVKIANGRYTLLKDASTIEYFCHPEYRLIGQQKLSCTSKLKWDSEPPVCTKMCKLLEQREVLSYRRKETYEIIPFGTEIINGTQVYSISRDDTSDTRIITCLNGVLMPRTSLNSDGRLSIYHNGEWLNVCHTSYDVCSIFGYREHRGEYEDCSDCSEFDERAFSDSSKIVFENQDSQDYDNFGQSALKCILCSEI